MCTTTLGSAAAVVNLVPGILESASRAKKIEVKTWRKKEKNKLVVKNDRNNSDTALDFSNRGGARVYTSFASQPKASVGSSWSDFARCYREANPKKSEQGQEQKHFSLSTQTKFWRFKKIMIFKEVLQ